MPPDDQRLGSFNDTIFAAKLRVKINRTEVRTTGWKVFFASINSRTYDNVNGELFYASIISHIILCIGYIIGYTRVYYTLV